MTCAGCIYDQYKGDDLKTCTHPDFGTPAFDTPMSECHSEEVEARSILELVRITNGERARV